MNDDDEVLRVFGGWTTDYMKLHATVIFPNPMQLGPFVAIRGYHRAISVSKRGKSVCFTNLVPPSRPGEVKPHNLYHILYAS